MWIYRNTLLGLTLVTIFCVAVFGDETDCLRIVYNNRSDFVIYCTVDSPQSVKLAANELQQYIQKTTKARLRIVEQPATPMISLGNNPTARKLGLLVEDIPLEGFRIVTQSGNLYILGQDTLDGEYTSHGGSSRGTLNGTYAFMEEFLDIRWLLPGPDGEDVPECSSLILQNVSISDRPDFEYRHIPYIQDARMLLQAWQNLKPAQGGNKQVEQWKLRQKLGRSAHYWFGHSWHTIVAEHFDYQKNPEWFPMSSQGKRIQTQGRCAKFCTTNPDVIEAVASLIQRHFRRHQQTYCYSLSPSDGEGWCECPKCQALDETDAAGQHNRIRRVVTFYNEVARSVGTEFPDKVLCGYIYASYIHPPKDMSSIRFPKTFVPVIASSISYGYRLWRPDIRTQWTSIMDSWQNTMPYFGYYDMPVRFEQTLGAPNPIGLKILKFLYPNIKNRGCQINYMCGVPAWGYAAPQNYLLAKLSWNANTNIDATFEEFCDRAYGKGGRDISAMFHLIDEIMEQYYIANDGYGYILNDNILKDVYATNFDSIEHLYFSAEENICSEPARKRLDMLGKNLAVFHWNLRSKGFLKNPDLSRFYRNSKDIKDLMNANAKSLELHPKTTLYE